LVLAIYGVPVSVSVALTAVFGDSEVGTPLCIWMFLSMNSRGYIYLADVGCCMGGVPVQALLWVVIFCGCAAVECGSYL
jgi:hypothetical protein